MFVRVIVFASLLAIAPGHVDGQQPETMSLLGEPLYAPKLPKAERSAADAELARAHAAYAAKPSGVAEVLALARAHLALGRIGDSLVVLTHGVEANPDALELLLERGNGYIVIRKFDVAARDLAKASTKLPTARCSLGLAQYLAADYERARATYKDCREPSVFAYLAERRAGGHPANRPVPDGPVSSGVAPIRLPGTVAKEKADVAEPLSASYLAAIELLLDGKTDAAGERLKKMLERHRGEWMQAPYIAAEADYARLRDTGQGKRKAGGGNR
jgi:tetratricopeptide (TPR) repeat protein